MTAHASPSGHASDGLAPAVSVVLCTFNRADMLAGALDALVHQAGDTPPYEVLVVDNNSTDHTRGVVRLFEQDGRVRYQLEPRQGLSTARNRGIGAARADVIAFTDDDVRVAADWIGTLARIFAAHPDIDMAGGKVEPQWEAPPPAWLASAGTAPLALVDYGDTPLRITSDEARCLVGANLAVRRRVFDRVGLFSTALQRVENGIGSTEDHEMELRVLAAGGTGLYDPRLVVRARVPPARLTKQYHRAWHAGHGRFFALMRDPSFEGPRRRALLGVPLHVYRKMGRELAAWTGDVLRLQPSAAFRRELRLRFLVGFTQQRIFGRM